jgi:hypothetical protein
MARVVSGSFTGTGQSASFNYRGRFNVSLSGVSGNEVSVERSFDTGSTWTAVESFTADTELYAESPEVNVLWRFNCTSYTSGTIVYRFSGE